jgi:SAM-dependent methyltransferase
LQRFVPERAAVAEVGVGAGHYSEFLARRGCRLDLLDVSESLLAAAQERLERAGLASRIAGIHHASATALPLADTGLDVIRPLGPLYHLRELQERGRRPCLQRASRPPLRGRFPSVSEVHRLAFRAPCGR